MLVVPQNPVPSQITNVTLGGQACTLNVYQKFFGMFCDVLVNNNPIIQGVLCHNRCYIVRSIYLGFLGDLVFFDTQGTSDPFYTGLGSRYLLIYLTQNELPPTYGLSL